MSHTTADFIGYFTVGGGLYSAESAPTWPRTCTVCENEHRKCVSSKSSKAALRHRRKKHAWLQRVLDRERSARPAGAGGQ